MRDFIVIRWGEGNLVASPYFPRSGGMFVDWSPPEKANATGCIVDMKVTSSQVRLTVASDPVDYLSIVNRYLNLNVDAGSSLPIRPENSVSLYGMTRRLNDDGTATITFSRPSANMMFFKVYGPSW